MATQINCPSCGRLLGVPEDLFGKRVQCPTCQSTFVAEVPGSAAAKPTQAAPRADDEEPPRPRRRPPIDDEDDYEEVPERRPRRRWVQPHRGTLILVLGILSLVMCGIFTGIPAWVMGNSDLAAMRRGEMDPSGEGTTQAGRICGMISCILWIAGCLIYALIFVIAIGAGAGGRR